MDNGTFFLALVAGIAIGGYLKEFLLYKTSHLWADQQGEDQDG